MIANSTSNTARSLEKNDGYELNYGQRRNI